MTNAQANRGSPQADRASSRLSISSSRCESKRSAFVVPAHLQSSPEFFVRHVQIPLSLLNARVSEHQLDNPDIDAVSQEATGAFVPEVVPAEVDLAELLAVPLRAGAGWSRLHAAPEEPQRFQAV